MKALVDADSLIFKCGFAVEHKKYKLFQKGLEEHGCIEAYNYKRDIPKDRLLDEEVSLVVDTEIEPLENCLHLVRQSLESILENTKATSYQVYIKGKGNFREEISKTRVYKGNRDVTHRPKYEAQIREYLIKYWGAEVVDGMEVDDKVCIEQSHDLAQFSYEEKCGDNYTECWAGTIICTIDKDLDQVPGWHYSYATNEKYWVEPEAALTYFYVQLLSGDASDNIEGLPKVGVKTAIKLLENTNLTDKDLYTKCLEVYQERLGESKGKQRLVEMASLLYLKRSIDDQWKPPV